jgi:hypothetical protein
MRPCPNGHTCDDDAKFCDTCGVALATTTPAPARDTEPWHGSLSELADDAAFPTAAEENGAPSVPVGQHSPPTEPHPEQPSEMPAAEGPGVVRRRGAGTVRGIARGVQVRSEPWGQGWSRHILSMRVEQYDSSGNRLQPVPVELRGWTLSGQVSEGEQVEVNGKWRRGVLRASRATNLSTGGTIDTHPWRYAVLYALAIAVFVAFLVFIFIIL